MSIIPHPSNKRPEYLSQQQKRFEPLAEAQGLNTKFCLTFQKYHDVRTQSAWELFQTMEAQRDQAHEAEVRQLKAKLIALQQSFDTATTWEDVRETFDKHIFDDLVKDLEAQGVRKFREWMHKKTSEYKPDLASVMLDNILHLYLEYQYPDSTETS